MKPNIFNLLLISLIFFSLSATGQVQSYPIKKVGTTEYYVYTVEAREGFYALQRKFGISQEDVIKHNPETKDGLKVGQQVLIPIPAKQPESNKDFILHTVEKQQTIYGISKQYNVSQEDIKKLNPHIGKDNNIQEGFILRIPTSTNVATAKQVETPVQAQSVKTQQPSETPAQTQPTTNTQTSKPLEFHISTQSSKDEDKTTSGEYITHTVRPKETLYAIGRHYNVFVEDIINYNPNLESTLKIGETIRIPKQSAYIVDISKKTEINIDELFSSDKKPLRVAFLLPFMTNNPKDQSTTRFLDFYAGALIAINDMKSSGISMEIYTYDTEKSEQKIREVLKRPELKNVDLIIGPAYTNQVGAVSEFAKTHKVHTLIPFTSRVSNIEKNPYLFQFNPGMETEISFFSNLLTDRYKNANLIFVQLDNIDSSDDSFVWTNTLQNELKNQGRAFNLEEWKNANILEIESKLRADKENLIIFKTDKIGTVEPYLNTLSSAAKKYNITLFSQYSWSAQPIKLKRIFISPFTEEMNSNDVTEFQKKHAHFFDREITITTPRYDLLGYDLTNCFIQLLEHNNGDLSNVKSSFSYSQGIQSQFKFEQKNNGGFINQRLYLTEQE